MNAAAAYGLELQARCLCSLPQPTSATNDVHRFLVGTSSFFADNKLHLLEYHDETQSLECASIWSYTEEVRGLWSSPAMTARGMAAVAAPYLLRVLQLTDDFIGEPQCVLEMKCIPHQVLWDLDGLQNEFILIEGTHVSSVSLEAANKGDTITKYTVSADPIDYAVLDPHNSSLCLMACGHAGMYLFDLREGKSHTILKSTGLHGFGKVRNVDFSPAKSNTILTAGDDGYIRLYDMRMDSEISISSSLHLKAHEHSIQKALFNPLHHDLVVSAGSDQSLGLWDVCADKAASRIKRLVEFGDTVMDVCWSGTSPWVFAGVSFNGKLIVDHVPHENKMSILLDEQ